MFKSFALLLVSTGFNLAGQSGNPNPAAAPVPQQNQPVPSTGPRTGGRFGSAQPPVAPQVNPGGLPGQPPEGQGFPRPGRFTRTEPGADAGTPTRDQPPFKHPRDKTLLVEVKQAKADILAKSLQKTYGDTMTIEVAAGTPMAAILLSGTEKLVQEAKDLVEKLDKPGSTVMVELTVVESAGNADEVAGQIRDATASGAISDDAWRALVKKLQTEGKITLSRTLEVKAAENQQARIQVGEDKPIATGSMVTSRGIASRNFSYRSVGSMATLTLRPGKAPGEFRVDLNFQDSRIVAAKPQPETPKEKDKDKEKEKPAEEFKPDSVLQFTAETSANLSPGKVVQVNSNREESKEGSRQVLVFLRLKSS